MENGVREMPEFIVVKVDVAQMRYFVQECRIQVSNAVPRHVQSDQTVQVGEQIGWNKINGIGGQVQFLHVSQATESVPVQGG